MATIAEAARTEGHVRQEGVTADLATLATTVRNLFVKRTVSTVGDALLQTDAHACMVTLGGDVKQIIAPDLVLQRFLMVCAEASYLVWSAQKIYAALL